MPKKKKHHDSGSDNGSSDEHACPAGYVILKEKNKYGSFCEPKEGSPEALQLAGINQARVNDLAPRHHPGVRCYTPIDWWIAFRSHRRI